MRRLGPSSAHPEAAAPPTPRSGHETPARVSAGRLIKRVVGFCLVAEIALVALDFAFNSSPVDDDLSIARIFDMTREASLPTWFGATQAVVVSLVALFVLLVRRLHGARRAEVVGWGAVSAVFLFVAVDDGGRVHERVGTAIGRAFEDEGGVPVLDFLLRTPSYYWIAVLGPLFAAAGVFLLVFLWRQLGPHKLRTFLVLGLALYALAIGLDFVEGLGDALGSIAARLDVSEYAVEHSFKVAEEYLELLATTIFLFVMLRFLATIAGGLRLEIQRETAQAAPPTPAP